MQINELTPGEVKAGLKKKNMKDPYKGQIKVDPSKSTLWANFKKWDTFLRKNGWKQLGNGSFAAVYGKTGLSYVIKVPFYRDRPWMRYAEYCMANKGNPHVMKVGFIKEETSNHFFIAAIERLKSFPEFPGYNMADSTALYLSQLRNDDSPKQVMQRMSKYADNLVDQKRANWLKNILMPQIPKLAETIIALRNIDHLDLHGGNIMMRGKTVVIVDPWFDWADKKPTSDLYS